MGGFLLINMSNKEVFLQFVSSAALVVYAVLTIVTCVGVWRAALGKAPDSFYIICSILHFLWDGYLVYKLFMSTVRKDTKSIKK